MPVSLPPGGPNGLGTPSPLGAPGLPALSENELPRELTRRREHSNTSTCLSPPARRHPTLPGLTVAPPLVPREHHSHTHCHSLSPPVLHLTQGVPAGWGGQETEEAELWR